MILFYLAFEAIAKIMWNCWEGQSQQVVIIIVIILAVVFIIIIVIIHTFDVVIVGMNIVVVNAMFLILLSFLF